jgi:GNAT superfamily N-acetyltransferase
VSTLSFRIVTAAEAPHLQAAMQELGGQPWPEFLLHSAVINRNWDHLYEFHPECQIAIIDAANETVVALGNSVPVRWDLDFEQLPEGGAEWALSSRFEGDQKDTPNLLCGLQVVVAPDHQGQGKSATMLEAMRKLAETRRLKHLIVPVRPVWKSRYPLVPMDRYVRWTRDDGLPYDRWIRVHSRLGARMCNVAKASMVIRAARHQWEAWTDMYFPESGDYIVPGGLVPMRYHAERGEGVYTEPNFWMLHP